METKIKEALQELRVDLVQISPEESLDVLIWDLMDHFSKLSEKVLTLRIKDKKEVIESIEKI